MAFCTKCGAAVGGAFCNHCGTPTGQASAQPMQAAPPPRRGMHPLAWVAIVIFGIFGLAVLGAIGTAVYVARNPARAVRRLIAATNPNVDVISTDEGAGTITLRDRRTGKIVTMSFDDARHGKFRFTADDGDGRTAEFQLGGEARLPSWLPAYPGSHPRGLFSASGDSGSDAGDAGSVSFTTADSGDKVLGFYEDKARDLGMHVRFEAENSRSRALVAEEDGHERGFKVIVTNRHGESNVTLTYGRKF
jgi:hypothetical protein